MARDTNIGAKRARDTREDLGLEAGAPLGCILTAVEAQLGIAAVIAALPENVAGCCWRDGEQVVLWVNGTQAAVRQRFTLAHELGHVRCGHDLKLPVDTFETVAGRTTDSREIQANAFAAELLAPAAGVREMCQLEPTLEDVVLIAARYGISAIAALYRLNTLGLTSRYETLKREIEEGLHATVWEALSPVEIEDILSTTDARSLPRLSPALRGSVLAALDAGTASIAEAASASGIDPQTLTRAAAAVRI